MPSNWIPKVHRGKADPKIERNKNCPAWPNIGEVAGSTREWCADNRGKMKACETCDWRER